MEVFFVFYEVHEVRKVGGSFFLEFPTFSSGYLSCYLTKLEPHQICGSCSSLSTEFHFSHVDYPVGRTSRHILKDQCIMRYCVK
jgi:hypothetical protein